MLSLTLAIIKPDISRVPYAVNAIRSSILNEGFLVLRSKSFQMPRATVSRFYQEHEGKFFFNRLHTFMSSGTCHVHVLGHPSADAIARWRGLMGPTKVLRTRYEQPHSIRGRFGLTDTRNGVHGSDSIANARKEIFFFFPDFDFQEEARKWEAFTGAASLDADKFVHTFPVR